MALQKTETVTFEESCCSECGITYFVPYHWRKQRREDHGTFYCPNGHGQHFPAASEAEKLRAELDAEKRRHQFTKNEAEAERMARESMEKKMKRAEKRIHNGVCPHCNRHFTNLERHMHTKHERKSSDVPLPMISSTAGMKS